VLKSIPELLSEYGKVVSKDRAGIIKKLSSESDTQAILAGLKEQSTTCSYDVEWVHNLLDIAYKIGSLEGYSAGVGDNFGDKAAIILYPEDISDVEGFIAKVSSVAQHFCKKCAIGTNIEFENNVSIIPESNN